ncbi:polysaccharide deacetylase [Natronorubrum sulfidifaciens JCM 14089]|uniref:Polysaccharide deacetylase n=1 Tax=Natronorubrum sulfidifaciens JCM 14089 TaxID=1230460 RepID=L9WIV2_9EURY|nr:polysaccharide deacetylase [Natronorubrum sulfidifaciens JCM 14089]
MFDRYSIPATWAVVGHLLLDECQGTHPDHPASDTGWFESDPGGSEATNERWFGSTLIEAIDEADTDHELGCHSFSHVLFDSDQITTEIAEAELQQCEAIAREHNLSFSSFVFPRNIIGFRELLPKYGFRAYRGRSPNRWHDESLIYPVAKFTNYTVGNTPPPLVHPEVDEHGLVNIPASLDLFSLEGTARRFACSFGEDPVLRQAKMGIDAAATDQSGVFHIWLHPNNLVRDADFDRLQRVLSYIADQRDRGQIAVETMADVTDRTVAQPLSQ